jgi:CheY-like chemotaxis protein
LARPAYAIVFWFKITNFPLLSNLLFIVNARKHTQKRWPKYSFCQSHLAYSAAEAKGVLEERKNIQVVITDITMPDESGIQLVKYINRDHKAIRCIFYSINDNPAYIFRAKNQLNIRGIHLERGNNKGASVNKNGYKSCMHQPPKNSMKKP